MEDKLKDLENNKKAHIENINKIDLQINSLTAQKQQLIANVNACEGGIQVINELMNEKKK